MARRRPSERPELTARPQRPRAHRLPGMDRQAPLDLHGNLGLTAQRPVRHARRDVRDAEIKERLRALFGRDDAD